MTTRRGGQRSNGGTVRGCSGLKRGNEKGRDEREKETEDGADTKEGAKRDEEKKGATFERSDHYYTISHSIA